MAAYLEVNVIAARNLPAELAESDDPYVVLEYKGKKEKTKADNNAGRNPNWNKKFSFALGHPPGTLDIRVFDQDLGFDDFKGKCEVNIGDIMNSGNRVRAWYPLSGKTSWSNNGEIELELIVTTSEHYSHENAAKLAALEASEDKAEINQMLAGVGALAAAGIAAYAGHQAATGQGNKTANSVIAGVAGAAALAAGGFAVSEHLRENKIEQQQEQLGEKKHGWFD